jgi:hypothetical protein
MKMNIEKFEEGEKREVPVEVKAAPRNVTPSTPLPEPSGEQPVPPPQVDLADMAEFAEAPDDEKKEEEIVAEPYFGQEDFRGAQYTLQKEEPQHRMICFLAAQGNTNTEIAEATGFTTAMIAYVKKQPWAQKRIADLQERSGRTAVMGILQGAALEAAKTLIAVIKNADEDGNCMNAKAADRAKASNDLLNRMYGQAPVSNLTGSVAAQDLSDAELAATVASGTVSKNN